MALSPIALLRAQTDAARMAIGERDIVRVAHFPFNVGRESRVSAFERLKHQIERRSGQTPQLNDLYLVDRREEGRNVSREHFRIDWRDGTFVVVDRGSTCGTIVGGRKIGKDAGTNEAALHDGDVIVVGTSQSPYVFQFQIESRG